MSEKQIKKIEKTWREFQQREMMWWVGIHIYKSPRAELSNSFGEKYE